MDSKNNTGKENSGDWNSGDYNSGYRNSGDCNSGDCNSGNCNSGHRNSGDCNSGNCNSGHRNSGNYNSGNYNSGYRNSGHCNSGDYNSGNYNSGFFNTDEPTVRMFNKDSGLKRSELEIPYIDLKLTEWISEENMTEQQKKDDPDFFVKKGTLIKRDHKEAWGLAWNGLSQGIKQKFLDLPNFNADIFEEITGINLRSTMAKAPTCDGKIVEIDGKKYKLTEV